MMNRPFPRPVMQKLGETKRNQVLNFLLLYIQPEIMYLYNRIQPDTFLFGYFFRRRGAPEATFLISHVVVHLQNITPYGKKSPKGSWAASQPVIIRIHYPLWRETDIIRHLTDIGKPLKDWNRSPSAVFRFSLDAAVSKLHQSVLRPDKSLPLPGPHKNPHRSDRCNFRQEAITYSSLRSFGNTVPYGKSHRLPEVYIYIYF